MFIKYTIRTTVLLVVLAACSACDTTNISQPLFKLLDNQAIGVDFANNLTSTNEFNVYKYRNFYNGGGVALGDVNNDGLIDMYFVSNQAENKLYLNKGKQGESGIQFEDVTVKAGVGGQKAWSTGVTFVDINNDGLLDIYVCNSGDIKGCLLYTSPSPRDRTRSRMPSSA